ncbi:MAG TPA: hypothetical protein DEO84_03130 [candidate division Zixibacteria bacterium]|nr:hypothetical protein [candidate division Zixibacteria bacterium]HBZ00294.1 hypothetical protein [candidate division Zixibacteria bacterium]
MIRYLALVMAFLILVSVPALAQRETADDSAYSYARIPRAPLRWTIDTPTAGMLPRGSFDLDIKTFTGGGIQTVLGIGLMNRFSVGLAYGASRVLSDTTPNWGPRLEFQLRYRLLEEGHGFPGIAVGFNSQGYGPYDDSLKRYQIKSQGFYVAFSTNFQIYSNNAGLHFGANYSLENDRDSDPSIFVGFNADLGNDMLFLSEYDFALNDNTRYSVYGKGRGFFNMGLTWYLTDGLSLELDLKNLLRNRAGAGAIDREARLVYTEFFY